MTARDDEPCAEMVEGTRLAALAHELKILSCAKGTTTFVRLYSPENAPQFLDVACMGKLSPATTVTLANESFVCSFGIWPADDPKRAARELMEAMVTSMTSPP